MHSNHRLLPYFARLDDGRVLERSKPDHAALVTASAQAHQARRDPLLVDLATDTLDAPVGAAVMVASTGARTMVDPPLSGGFAMVGLRCPTDTAAVASIVPCETVWTGGGTRRGALAWSVNRQGESLAMFREQPAGGVEILSELAGTLLDWALRALGHETPPCPSPSVWFPDGVFLHRLARLLDRRGGMCTRRPLCWDSLSLLYPLNGSGEVLPACLTRHLRQDFHEYNPWSSLRRRVIDQTVSAPAIVPGITPEVAAWLDDGSFARWVLSRFPDVPSTLEWLCGRVDDDLANELLLALGDVHDPAEGAR